MDNQKLKGFIVSRPPIEEKLKEVIWMEEKWYQIKVGFAKEWKSPETVKLHAIEKPL